MVFEIFDGQSNYKRVEEVTRTDNTLYSASVELGDMAGDPYTLFAVFSDGEETRTEPLLRIDGYSSFGVSYEYQPMGMAHQMPTTPRLGMAERR